LSALGGRLLALLHPQEENALTIVAGFVCMDGVVLCADSQEVIPDFTKNETEKIRTFKDMGLSIAISGAGHSEIIEAGAQLIEGALVDEYSKDEPYDRCQDLIRSAVQRLFEQSIRPYADFPSSERPFADFLIAVGVSNKFHQYDSLIKVSGTTVRTINPGGECIGSGLMIAKGLIERLYSPFMKLDELILIACYILYHTKRWTDGCGGNTDVWVSSAKHNFCGGVLPTQEIRALEDLFESFDERVASLLVKFVDKNTSETEFNRAAGQMNEELGAVRKRKFKDANAAVDWSFAALKKSISKANL
jgi:20S proteasome alpha/beta subunit